MSNYVKLEKLSKSEKGKLAALMGPFGGVLLQALNKTEAQKLYKSAVDKIAALESLINKGAPDAPAELYHTAMVATGVLTRQCEKDAALFTGIAQKEISWPVLYSPHPDQKQKADELVKQLGLGTKTNINLLSLRKRFSWKKPANVVAFRLHQLAQTVCRAPMRSWAMHDFFIVGVCCAGCSSQQFPKQCEALERWGQRGAGKRLPPLSKETASQWAEAIKELFPIIYGENFEEHPNLQELRQSVCETAKDAYDNVGGRAAVRKRMHQAVKQAWHSIAAMH
jgi:hypothetical protein